eukprot:842899-Rhodomonas_salina.2
MSLWRCSGADHVDVDFQSSGRALAVLSLTLDALLQRRHLDFFCDCCIVRLTLIAIAASLD